MVAEPSATPVISTVLPLISAVALALALDATVTVVVAFAGVSANGTTTFLPASTVAVSEPAVIAVASTTASNEVSDGSHLHLTLYHNGVEVDPNNYLDLQNK